MSRKVQPTLRHTLRRVLDCNEDGYPKLPLPRQQGAKLAEEKELIRAFMTTTYRKCYVTILGCESYRVVGQASGNEKAVIPWGDLALRASEYIKGEYVPDGIVFRDPSHLRQDDVTALLSHWYQRQQEDEKVLRFHRVLGAENELIEPRKARAAHAQIKVKAGRGARSRLRKKDEAEADGDAVSAGGDGETRRRGKQTKRRAGRRRLVKKGKGKMKQGGGGVLDDEEEMHGTTSRASTPEWEADYEAPSQTKPDAYEEVHSTTSRVSTPEWEAHCETPPETKRATVIRSAAGPGRSSQGFSLAHHTKMTTPVNDTHHVPTLPTPDLTPTPRAKDSTTPKPSNRKAAKTARTGSRARRKVGSSLSVKDDPEISLSEMPERLEPELQGILAKYNQLPEAEIPPERPKPRRLTNSKQDPPASKEPSSSPQSLLQNRVALTPKAGLKLLQLTDVGVPSSSGKVTNNRRKGTGDMKGMTADMRLRSASKPRRSPRKHSQAVGI